MAGGRSAGQVTSREQSTLVSVGARPHTIVAYGHECGGGYSDDNQFQTSVALDPGDYFMHTGQRQWDGSYWTVADAATDEIIAGGSPEFGCCADGSNEDITQFSVSAPTTAIITITTWGRTGPAAADCIAAVTTMNVVAAERIS